MTLLGERAAALIGKYQTAAMNLVVQTFDADHRIGIRATWPDGKRHAVRVDVMPSIAGEELDWTLRQGIKMLRRWHETAQ